jgi:hypothetical protein
LSAYRHVLGWTYFRLGMPEPATIEFQQALTLDPNLEGAKQGLAAIAAAR